MELFTEVIEAEKKIPKVTAATREPRVRIYAELGEQRSASCEHAPVSFSPMYVCVTAARAPVVVQHDVLCTFS